MNIVSRSSRKITFSELLPLKFQSKLIRTLSENSPKPNHSIDLQHFETDRVSEFTLNTLKRTPFPLRLL